MRGEGNTSPLRPVAAFLVLLGTAYRLTFSASAAPFLDNALADLIIFCALLFYMVSLLRPGAASLRVNLASGAIVFFTIGCFLAARRSYYPAAATQAVMNAAAMACLFVVVSGALFGRQDAPRAAVFLVALSVISLAVALLQYWELPRLLAQIKTQTPPFTFGNQVITEKIYADFLTRFESREVFSTFYISNVLAGFLALCLPVALGLAAAAVSGSGTRRFKAAAACTCGALSLVMLVVILMTKSKGGMAAAAGGVLIFAVILLYRLLPRRYFFALVAACLIVGGSAFLLALPRARQYIDEAKTSLDIRLGYWRVTARVIREAPIEGVGPGNFDKFYFKHRQPAEREVRNPHNAPLLVWAEAGVFTLMFFAAFWVLVFAGPKERQGPPPARVRSAAALALPAAAALSVAMLALAGGLAPGQDRALAMAIAAGAIAGALFAYLLWPREGTFDLSLVRAGLAGGIAGFLLSTLVDVTFSDAGAATAAVFAAAAFSPRGKSAVLKSASPKAVIVTGLVAAGLVAFMWLVFLPVSQAETALEAARSDLREGRLAAARARAEEAAKLAPANAEPLAVLAMVWEAGAAGQADSPDFVRARDSYRAALQIDCFHRGALEGLSRLYAKGGPEYIIDELTTNFRLLAIYPASSRYHIMAAGSLEKLGLEAEAARHYRTALAIDDKAEQHGIQLSDQERAGIEAKIARLERGT